MPQQVVSVPAGVNQVFMPAFEFPYRIISAVFLVVADPAQASRSGITFTILVDAFQQPICWACVEQAAGSTKAFSISRGTTDLLEAINVVSMPLPEILVMPNMRVSLGAVDPHPSMVIGISGVLVTVSFSVKERTKSQRAIAPDDGEVVRGSGP